MFNFDEIEKQELDDEIYDFKGKTIEDVLKNNGQILFKFSDGMIGTIGFNVRMYEPIDTTVPEGIRSAIEEGNLKIRSDLYTQEELNFWQEVYAEET
jgi:hypothetical protein